MFKVFRKHTKAVVWVIVVTFALWGGSSVAVSWQREARFAGEAFGKPVSHREFDAALKAIQIFTVGTPPANTEAAVWQHIVLLREAERRGIQVSDGEVREEIRRFFDKEGVPFDPERYRLWVRNVLREEPRFFEEQIRDLVLIGRLKQEILGSGGEPKKRNPFRRYRIWLRKLMERAKIKSYVKFR